MWQSACTTMVLSRHVTPAREAATGDTQRTWRAAASQNWPVSTVNPVLNSHTREAQKWLLKAGGCLNELNISTNWKFGNILFGCLKQVGCLIEVTANTGLTVPVRDGCGLRRVVGSVGHYEALGRVREVPEPETHVGAARQEERAGVRYTHV